MVAEKILTQVLDRIEAEESKLLTWGDTGAFFSEREIIDLISEVAPSCDGDDILEALLDSVMLYEIIGPDGNTQGYRSRMGESVHLYRNLRQWFHGKQIVEASTLVSDFRFLRRPRLYPRRDLQIEDLFSAWEESLELGVDVKAAIESQIGNFALSGFQARATERILEAFEQHRTRGTAPSATIICAGTGSGKTLAFYLPALSSIASEVIKDPRPRVRVLAIYPRNELLKDQFNETWRQCRRLDELVLGGAKRKLRIGAFYGDTKDNIRYALKDNSEYLDYDLIRCATPSCQGSFRWLKDDVDNRREKLTCNGCGVTVSDDEVVLTRTSMAQSPPDIVFTTTEMLNQQIGNPRFQRVFGINTDQPIPLILLDEVHTYGGNQGAQTAFLLRRWMKMSWTRPHFVGLSATLTDAEEFFSRLTSVHRNRVRLIESHEKEMIEEGAEYLLALRGDPVSQTALLSTTIQAAMLTRRLLDCKGDSVSDGTWGSRTFIFTDNLDVTNRLYWNLADAEGWINRRGRLQAGPRGPLASLRNPSSATKTNVLRAFGQDWGIAKEIGHTLGADDRAIVSRTSSQDSGVDVDAELVVASPSLEVGFNDSTIGAVIQHKAPRNMASYLQRKGRGGRTRAMRPWTIVVLSDFGRDRVTYQHYEKLLDPEITLQRLPTENSHVHRMQAAMAVLDWLSIKSKQNMWYVFNKPSKIAQNQLSKVHTLIKSCLYSEDQQSELRDYLSKSLRLPDEQLSRVLWQSPRAIFLEFLPLLKRRLETKWGAWDSDRETFVPWVEVNNSWRSPVPEFIPDNLFSDLNLPALHIRLSRGERALEEGMSFFQGLDEFAPGRISKRYAVRSGWGSDWVVPGDYDPAPVEQVEDINVEIEEVFPKYSFVESLNDSDSNLNIVLPHFVSTRNVPDKNSSGLLPTSNARLVWHSRFIPSQTGGQHKPPLGNAWNKHLSTIRFHTHRSLTQLQLIRYSTGSKAELRFQSGGKARLNFHWSHNNQSIGVGTRMWVDAAEFEFIFTDEHIAEWLGRAPVLRTLRSAYLQDRLRTETVFEGNTFTSDWVWECFTACLAVHVASTGQSTVEAIKAVLSGGGRIPLRMMPTALFQEHILDDGSLNPLELNEAKREQRLRSDLEEILTSQAVITALENLAFLITDDVNGSVDFLQWCRMIVANTLAGALSNTLCALMPDVDETAFVADPVVEKDFVRVWIVEQESGGAGLVGLFEDRFGEDPVATLNTFARCLQPNEYEQLDFDLHYLLRSSRRNHGIASALKMVREASDFSTRMVANNHLKKLVSSMGIQCSHSFTAVLHSRILRAGSAHETDMALLGYLDRWDDLQQFCGFEVPVNVAALVMAVEREGNIDFEHLFSSASRIGAVMWPRGAAVRQNVLGFYNRFQSDNLRTERLLGACLCLDETPVVLACDADWLAQVHQYLEGGGVVDLHIEMDEVVNLKRLLVHLQTNPLDAMGLFFYPRISSMMRREDRFILRVEFAEAIQ